MTKFTEKSSSFKKTLKVLPIGSTIMTAGLDGEFILPETTNQPLVFIAGGVGIAPFRSMIKDMLDKKIQRPITLLYSNNTAEEICFKQLFEEANQAFGMKTVYSLTNLDQLPKNWGGNTGYIDEALIKNEVADYKHAWYYISGPDPMVRAMKKTLRRIGIANRHIKSDYFPGYA